MFLHLYYLRYFLNQVQSQEEHLNKIRQDSADDGGAHRHNALQLSTLGASLNVCLCVALLVCAWKHNYMLDKVDVSLLEYSVK